MAEPTTEGRPPAVGNAERSSAVTPRLAKRAAGEPRPYQEVKAEAFEAEAPTAKN